MGLCLLTAACFSVLVLPGLGQEKKLEVAVQGADIRLDPDEKSPLVAALSLGTELTQASDVKFRKSWLYVYFKSPGSECMRSGYVLESATRKLYPVVKSVNIASEDEIMNPKDLDLTASYLPSIEWGVGKDKILRTEGRPFKQEPTPEGEVLQYRREIVNKRCLVEYVFAKNRLVTTRFYLLERYVDRNRYIEEYRQVKEFLNHRVGVPRADRMTWLDPVYARQGGSLGQALGSGHLEFSAEWVFRDTSLNLILASADSRVFFGAEIFDVKVRNPASF